MPIDDDKELDTHGDDEIEAGQEDETLADEDGDEVEASEDGDEEDSGDEAEGREEGRSRERETEDVTPRRRGASEVIRDNKRRAKEAERRFEAAERAREAAERRAEAAERAVSSRQQTESAQDRANRLAQMSPEERFDALRSEDQARNDARFNALQFANWDSSDRTKFERLADKNPLYAKVEAKVEARFAELQRQGSPVSREILAKLEIGEMMVSRHGAAKTKQTRRAEEGVRRETVKPRRAASDAQASRGRRGQDDSPEARSRRLENVIL